jgi:uncharacterized membrane protein
MPFVTTFIVLSVLGLIDASYLFTKHREHKPLVCPLNHDCGAVTESKWATMFGVRNETLGVLYYLGLFFGILAIILAPNFTAQWNIALLLQLGTGAGLLFSLFLVYLQKYVLKNYCFYCLISAGITLLLFLNSFALR